MSSISLQTLEIKPAHTMLTPWLGSSSNSTALLPFCRAGRMNDSKLCSPGIYIGNSLESKDSVNEPAKGNLFTDQKLFL